VCVVASLRGLGEDVRALVPAEAAMAPVAPPSLAAGRTPPWGAAFECTEPLWCWGRVGMPMGGLLPPAAGASAGGEENGNAEGAKLSCAAAFSCCLQLSSGAMGFDFADVPELGMELLVAWLDTRFSLLPDINEDLAIVGMEALPRIPYGCVGSDILTSHSSFVLPGTSATRPFKSFHWQLGHSSTEQKPDL